MCRGRKLSSATGSTDSSEKKTEEAAAKEITCDFESVPLNESFTYEESIGNKDEMTSFNVDVLADLENLLSSGISELAGESDEEEKEKDDFEILDSPFPMGVQVFDDSDEDFEELVDSNQGIDDYEVICVSETHNIPAAQEERFGTAIGHGAQFMMKKTATILGSFLPSK